VNSHNIVELVGKAGQGIRNLIKNELKNRLISIKLDIASRHGRSMLAINTQFYSSDKKEIVIRTLATIELKKISDRSKS
jgi:hypothetical protein